MIKSFFLMSLFFFAIPVYADLCGINNTSNCSANAKVGFFSKVFKEIKRAAVKTVRKVGKVYSQCMKSHVCNCLTTIATLVIPGGAYVRVGKALGAGALSTAAARAAPAAASWARRKIVKAAAITSSRGGKTLVKYERKYRQPIKRGIKVGDIIEEAAAVVQDCQKTAVGVYKALSRSG